MNKALVLAALLSMVLGSASTVRAQEDTRGHASHHPGAAALDTPSPAMPGTPASPAPAGGMNMMDMMKGMMGPASPATPPAPASASPPTMPMPMPGSAAPAAATPQASSPTGGPAGAVSGSAGGGMAGGGMAAGGMAGGGCCGGGGAKPFYPALMDMPVLTPEARRFIEAEADRRLGTGTEQITAGQAALHRALGASDGGAVQLAAAGVRRGLLLVESGASAEQAVGEGQPPTKIALTWFKSQANVPGAGTPTTGGMSMDSGPWGLSWYHLTLMLFLVAFLAAALAIRFARARRVAGLVERLGGPDAGGAKPPDKPAPPAPAGAKAALPPPAAAAKPAAPTAPAAVPSAMPPADVPQKLWSGPLRVAAIFQETPNVKTFRFMEPGGGAIPFTFLPGQFLSFSAAIDGKPIRRSYTIASSPTQRDYVELTVKREEHGVESRYLHDCVAVGDLLEVKGPSGVFTFTGSETDSIVLIAGGVGITPMMCITRFLTDRAYRGDIFFLYGAKTPEEFIFCEEIHYLQKRHPNLHLAVTMSEAEHSSWTGAAGIISKAFIERSVPHIARRRVHVCGPPLMTEAVMAALAELGLHKEQIRTEAFGAKTPPPKAAPDTPAQPSPSSATPPASPAVSTAAAAPAASAAATAPDAPPGDAGPVPSAQATVQFTRSGKTGPLAPDQSVLEAAEAIGVSIDFVCRVGTCGTCVVPLTSGTVTMAVEDGLPADQKAKGIILACQAKSVAPLVVDA